MFPHITVAIPTYNEEKNIGRCLKSIFKQYYPPRLLKVFVVDGYSTDQTVKIAQKYPIKLIYNKARDAQVGKMLALKRAKGELFLYLDADVELAGRNWLRKMVYPLQQEPEVIGSFTHVLPKKSYSLITRYLTLHPLQCDPLYQYFIPDVSKTIIASRKNYQICQYRLGAIPPTGRCLYRRKKIMATKIGRMKKFMELDNLTILVKAGYDKFAYVPTAGYYHPFVRNLGHLVRKRWRNIENNYLPHLEKREYLWFNPNSKKDVLRIIGWVIYAHLLFPALVKGIVKTIKHRNWVGLYEPVITLVATDAIIFGFLRHPKGRAMVKKMLRNFFRKI